MPKTILYVRTTARTSPGAIRAGDTDALSAMTRASDVADLDMTKEVA